ncbi:MAG: nucleotidyltransferase family protein [Planctomycetes bacterium]|nr:nucleotidyltransferase family protein [Planctomycetota bacterium]
MPLGLELDPAALAALCRRYHVAKLELFGSRAKGTARPESDVDLLVTFEPGQTPGLEFFGMAEEFASVFDRPVDLFTRDSVERSPNPYKRDSILTSAEPLYVAA